MSPKQFQDQALIKDLDTLCLSEPASPPHPRGRLDHEQLIEQFKEMRVEGRKTLFSTLVDCAKGFLTVEVTTIGDTPLNGMPQILVTTTPISLTVTTIAAVVTTVITPIMTTTLAVAITTAITPVTPAQGRCSQLCSTDHNPHGGSDRSHHHCGS